MNQEIKFDYAKIRKEFGKLWLFLGDYRHTKDNAKSVWIDQNGNEKHWSYIEWKVVASGRTWDEFLKSAAEYFKLCKMTMIDYLEEECGCDLTEYRKYMADNDKIRNISEEVVGGLEEIRKFKHGQINLITHRI